MADEDDEKPTVRLTRRGAAKRTAIVAAAAELMYVNGASSTSVDEVLTATSTSKSQFYRHFTDKADLVHAVIEFRAEEILNKQTARLQDVDSIRGLQRWGDAFLQRSSLRRGAWGCELGSLAAELSDVDEYSRTRLAYHFGQWQKLLAESFNRMRQNGILRPDTETTRLSVAVMAAIQGGYLLAQTAHDSAPMAIAVAMAMAHVQAHQTGLTTPRPASIDEDAEA